MISSASRRRSNLSMVAALAAGALMLSACGSSSDAATGNTTTLKVGATPSLSGLGLRLAMENGQFDKAGLKVDPVPNQTANAAIPALLNGQIQIAQVDTLTMLLAAAKGLPIRIVAGASEQASNGEAGTMTQASLLVRPDSDIKTPKDLVGRKVAVPAIKTQTWMNISALVDAAGGDSTKVQFVEVPPDQMLDLLAKGTVDAVDVNEPLGSAAIASGKARLLNNADAPGAKGSSASMYVTSASFLAKNGAAVKKFAMAIDNAAATGNSDRALELKVAQDELGFKSEELKNAVIPQFSSEPLTAADITKVADLAVKYGVLDKAPDINSLLVTK
ncbi:ABC transporter substrate-binding protein [Nocardioides sp. Iso805N]|uniref:ABC transporter substrate-binding protein n=1 Tax=Nocardioides sp. Iso805N TaxID=1283287 RepID=UPI000375CDBB|nr:ABC transporter substrate-binding protein [Nocardioides sp. Iso805N]